MNEQMIGTIHWHGILDGKSAIILSYYGGATLWVLEGTDMWAKYATGDTPNALIPHQCEKCGSFLPHRIGK